MSHSLASPAPAAAVGTSLEILAPYLPYGIDTQVKTGWGGGLDVMHGKLVGLLAKEERPVMLEMVNQGGIKTFLSEWALAECLPLLRPFAALCAPLPDGTVPAVEVAKLLPDSQFYDYEGAYPVLMNESKYLVVLHRNGFELATLYPDDYGIGESGFETCLRVFDYLRHHHFALPVNGHPLGEGVDFIAKSAAPPAGPAH